MKKDIYLGLFYEFVLKRNLIFALSNFGGGQKRVGRHVYQFEKKCDIWANSFLMNRDMSRHVLVISLTKHFSTCKMAEKKVISIQRLANHRILLFIS